MTDPVLPSGSDRSDDTTIAWNVGDATATLSPPDAGAGGSGAPGGPTGADGPGGSGPGDSAGDDGTASADAGAPATPVKAKKGVGRQFLEWIVLIAVALGIAFLIKSFLFQAFYIPSESMTPTLQVGDRVLVNKLSYDLHDVNRGDIIVFTAPARARTDGIEDLVKRAIGLPGDTVTSDGSGGVAINGRKLDEPYLPKGVASTFTDVPPGCGAPPSGQPGCVVPKGRLFMMGDNREASKDSRVFGPIAESSIVGRVFVRIWPLSDIGLL